MQQQSEKPIHVHLSIYQYRGDTVEDKYRNAICLYNPLPPELRGWMAQTYWRNTSYFMHIHQLNRFSSEAPCVELLLNSVQHSLTTEWGRTVAPIMHCDSNTLTQTALNWAEFCHPQCHAFSIQPQSCRDQSLGMLLRQTVPNKTKNSSRDRILPTGFLRYRHLWDH